MIQRRYLAQKDEKSTEEIEGEHIMKSIFEHDVDHGGITCMCMGIPGSAKTAVCCTFADYILANHFNERVWWRSSMYSPVQFIKLKNKWKVYVEADAGIRLFCRFTGKDITDKLEVVYFTDFNDLYEKADRGCCNAVFFGNSDIEGVPAEIDQGNIKWMRFIRYLLGKHEWNHVIADEYFEMAGARPTGKMWRITEQHAQDISNARKSNLNLYANCHQPSEVDFRIMHNIMILVFLHGAHIYKHSRVNKPALDNLPKPTHTTGAYGWVSHGSKFGRVHFPIVYKPKKNLSFEAKFDGC